MYKQPSKSRHFCRRVSLQISESGQRVNDLRRRLLSLLQRHVLGPGHLLRQMTRGQCYDFVNIYAPKLAIFTLKYRYIFVHKIIVIILGKNRLPKIVIMTVDPWH
jgi:hypothetical protein